MKIDRDISDCANELYKLRGTGGPYSLMLAQALQTARNDARRSARDEARTERERCAKLVESFSGGDAESIALVKAIARTIREAR